MASTRNGQADLATELETLESLSERAAHYGDNVAVTVADGRIVIIIDPSENQGPSSSARNYTIASTRGNVKVDPESGCVLTLTAYRKPENADERAELAKLRAELAALA